MQSSAVSFEASASYGALAQLGERLLCKQEVIGSIPIRSMPSYCVNEAESRALGLERFNA